MSRDLTRLAEICGMFGSDHAGERASAAAQAESLRRKLGKTWDQLLGARDHSEPTLDPATMTPGQLGGAFQNILTDWERQFLQSIAGRFNLTVKQREVVARIRRKCCEWWAGQEAGQHAA